MNYYDVILVIRMEPERTISEIAEAIAESSLNATFSIINGVSRLTVTEEADSEEQAAGYARARVEQCCFAVEKVADVIWIR